MSQLIFNIRIDIQRMCKYIFVHVFTKLIVHKIVLSNSQTDTIFSTIVSHHCLHMHLTHSKGRVN